MTTCTKHIFLRMDKITFATYLDVYHPFFVAPTIIEGLKDIHNPPMYTLTLKG